MRRIIILVAVAALLAASLEVSPSPAMAQDWNDSCVGVSQRGECIGIGSVDNGWNDCNFWNDCRDWSHVDRNDCDHWRCGDWNHFDWGNDCDRWDCADFEVDDCWFLWWDQFGDPVFLCEVDID
jgi:uncharacterized membrane protein